MIPGLMWDSGPNTKMQLKSCEKNMINGKSVLCLIPAREGSKGLPGKNIKDLCGKPLIAWPIETALESSYIDNVVVSTDSKKISDIAKSFGANVPFIRPSEFAKDESTTFSVINHAIEYIVSEELFYQYLVLLEPTSPLTTSQDVDEALRNLESHRFIADSIVGVCENETKHPVFNVTINVNGLIEPYIKDLSKSYRRQDLKKLYFKEGSLYISDIAVLLKVKSFYHDRTMPFIVPKWKAFEIDDITDLICIESIMKNIDLLNKE